MAITSPLFINEFQKGAQENASLGTGSLVGIDTYSKKGVAQLSKRTLKESGSVVTDTVISFAALNDQTIFGQGDTGKVYKTIDGGVTWTDISPGTLTGGGDGIIVFDNVLYAFRGTNIDYLKTPYAAAGWVQGWQTGLSAVGNHFPFLFPNAYGFYFCNGNTIGILREATVGTLVDPATAGTYFYDKAILTLPNYYTTNCLSFLPPSQLMIGTGSSDHVQLADIISWDTVSANKFGAPLRLYSTANSTGGGGVKQLINRNNVLYAVTAGNHCIFQTNGTTFNEVADISLRTNIRSTSGAQITQPIFLFPRQGAIALVGNKLLTGVRTATTYAPNGYFPVGVWTVAFTDSGNAIQCEYVISTGTTVAQHPFDIGALFPINDSSVLIGWMDNSSYGIDLVSITDFQSDPNNVIIESEMLEVGTPLNPVPIKTIQLNLTRNLVTGQTISVYARTSFDQNFVLVETFAPSTTSPNTGFKVQKNAIGSTRFVQLQIHMHTGVSTNSDLTPELRNVIIE